ncbi:MAG: Nif3-like dinuclear metal center hexameric protein [Sediminicola sp.]
MIVKQITEILEELAPLDYAEDFDNVGLLLGDPQMRVSGILVSLDTLENVVDEAIDKNRNLIVSFHPIIFKGLTKITGRNYVERVVLKCIQNNIALYSMHTALDNMNTGVNAKICEVLGILHPKILIPQKGTIKKLTTYVPVAEAGALKEALFAAGAGNIGKYANCSFSVNGTGSYLAKPGAHPTKGAIGAVHYEEEVQIGVIYPKNKEKQVLSSLFEQHPYEEVAYEIQTLENSNQDIGMGMVGELEGPMEAFAFMQLLKERMNVSMIRHTELPKKKIKRIAVLGGSGAFAIGAAKMANADMFITSDIKYHQFYEAENKLVIADIGHYETEQFTKNLIVDHLTKKIPNFAVSLAESITNPIKYF